MNGVPVIATNRGGLPEATSGTGLLINMDNNLLQPPYTKIPNDNVIDDIKNNLINLFNDQHAYQKLSTKCAAGSKQLQINRSLNRLDSNLTKILNDKKNLD